MRSSSTGNRQKDDQKNQQTSYVELQQINDDAIKALSVGSEEEVEAFEFLIPQSNIKNNMQSEQDKNAKDLYFDSNSEQYENYEERKQQSGPNSVLRSISEQNTGIIQESNFEELEEFKEGVMNYHIIIAANPYAGSRRAARYIRDYGGKAKYLCVMEKNCYVHVFDVTKQQQAMIASIRETLEHKLDDQSEIIVSVMGGDGSLGCVLDSLVKDEVISINLGRIIFAPLPYGTGNDLGMSLGWGKSEGKWGRNLLTLVESFLNAKRDRLAIWEVEMFAHYTEGYSNKKRVKISKEGEHFKKMMCCYFNLGIDAVVSNSFENYRSGNRHLNNLIYTCISLKHFCCFCCNPFSVKDFIDQVSENHGAISQTVFEASQIPHEPFVFVGTNLPSFYGGLASEGWHKNKDNMGFPDGVIEIEKLGEQYYHDNKIELLGAHSKYGLLIKQEIRRFCQLEGDFEFTFRRDLPGKIPFFFTVDGENFVLIEPEKLVFSQFKHAQRIRILRGPKRHLRA